MTSPVQKVARTLSSLHLTVVLLALSIVLIFAGTWAQIDLGIWATLKTYFRTFFVWIPFQLFLPRQWDVPGGFPFPGGYVLGGLLMVNLVTAHVVRFKFNRQRIGILLVHFGLILLIVSELVTALYAHESNMTIDEGQTVNYTEDTRAVELAIIDPSRPDRDLVVVVPQSRLQRHDTIRHDLLPFEIRVDSYYPNAELMSAESQAFAALPRATEGIAAIRNIVAVEKPVASGVRSDLADLPAALLTLTADGNQLGSWLVSLYFFLSGDFDQPLEGGQIVVAGGKTYEIGLRYQRTYKPYSLQLIDFRHDRYLGTDTPKNFSSQVRLIDPTRNEDREVLIYMNNPLRYHGETFYQASFKRGDTATILQVVRNPGWLLPYIACTVGGIGMLIHFGLHLTRFLRRSRA